MCASVSGMDTCDANASTADLPVPLAVNQLLAQPRVALLIETEFIGSA